MFLSRTARELACGSLLDKDLTQAKPVQCSWARRPVLRTAVDGAFSNEFSHCSELGNPALGEGGARPEVITLLVIFANLPSPYTQSRSSCPLGANLSDQKLLY